MTAVIFYGYLIRKHYKKKILMFFLVSLNITLYFELKPMISYSSTKLRTKKYVKTAICKYFFGSFNSERENKKSVVLSFKSYWSSF